MSAMVTCDAKCAACRRWPCACVTDDQVLALQAHAVATNDMRLLYTTYDALGVSRRYAFMPVTEGERRRARESCAATLEMMRAMGEQLRALEAA